MLRVRGLWDMHCFNGLSAEQQHRVVHHGNLPFGYEPEGDCPNGAEVEVTTIWDEFPGPRFYCCSCAIEFLKATASTPRPAPPSGTRPGASTPDSDVSGQAPLGTSTP